MTTKQAVELTRPKRLKVALDVIGALEFLHDRKSAIVHRDVKPANVLLVDGLNHP